MDIQEWEFPAIEHGGKMGIEYLNSIGVVPAMTQAQWHVLAQVMCMAYHMKRVEIQPRHITP